MKKKISLLLAILMLVTLIPTAFAESKTVDAVKNTKKVTLDGEEVMVGAYDVEGYNYLKLRDVAAILNGKKCQFSVGYDETTKLISVELAKAYEKVEGDLAEIKDEKAKAIIRVIKILVNGEEKEVKTALINENNYMQLRDLASLVGLGVKYDAANKVIMLKSDAEAKEEKPEEKEEDKKDEKKEDKEKKFSKEDNAIFDLMIAQNNTSINRYNGYDQVPLTDDNPMATIVNMSTLYGARIYTEGAKIEKNIEDVDGFRTHIIKFTYPGGGVSIMKTVPAEEEGKLQFVDSVEVGPVIRFIDEEKDIRNMSKEELQEKFTKVHDALADKDYKKASEILRELNYDASEEMVKEIAERKIADAKRFGGEIFSKDYEVNYVASEIDNEKYNMIIFRYKNGMVFRFDVYPPLIKGFASVVLVPHN